MALRYYANAAATTLTASITNSSTTMPVASVTGLPTSYPYTMILDRGQSTEEVVSVTAAAGLVLTITRGTDGTTAFAHNNGASVVHGISAQDPREANQHVNASSGVHGLAGSVVGTTDTQTLTNKTLGTTNTINGFTVSRFMEADGTGKLVSGTKTIPTGDVVGTTDTQTLTNKTITHPTTGKNLGSGCWGRIFRASSYAVASSTWTQVTMLTTDLVGAGGVTSPSAGRLQVPVTGLYLVVAQAQWQLNGTGARYVAVLKNSGGLYTDSKQVGRVGENNGSVGGHGIQCTGIVALTANDILDLWVYQDSGATVSLDGSSVNQNETWLAVTLISAAT